MLVCCVCMFTHTRTHSCMCTNTSCSISQLSCQLPPHSQAEESLLTALSLSQGYMYNERFSQQIKVYLLTGLHFLRSGSVSLSLLWSSWDVCPWWHSPSWLNNKTNSFFPLKPYSNPISLVKGGTYPSTTLVRDPSLYLLPLNQPWSNHSILWGVHLFYVWILNLSFPWTAPPTLHLLR